MMCFVFVMCRALADWLSCGDWEAETTLTETAFTHTRFIGAAAAAGDVHC
jgi:hypothetical protein